MGTRERKQREFAAREQLFLDTARQLIREEGLLTLQMARLARACDYATGTLYQHFESKEDLLAALAANRMAEHARAFELAAQYPGSSRERMFAVAVLDARFTRQHRGYGRLMQFVFTEVVWENASDKRRQALLEAARPASTAVASIVRQAIEAGDLDPGPLNPEEIMLGSWALCAGMQDLLKARGLLAHLNIQRPEYLQFHHTQVLLNGLGWQPLFALDQPDALNALVERIEQHFATSPRPQKAKETLS